MIVCFLRGTGSTTIPAAPSINPGTINENSARISITGVGISGLLPNSTYSITQGIGANNYELTISGGAVSPQTITVQNMTAGQTQVLDFSNLGFKITVFADQDADYNQIGKEFDDLTLAMGTTSSGILLSESTDKFSITNIDSSGLAGATNFTLTQGPSANELTLAGGALSETVTMPNLSSGDSAVIDFDVLGFSITVKADKNTNGNQIAAEFDGVGFSTATPASAGAGGTSIILQIDADSGASNEFLLSFEDVTPEWPRQRQASARPLRPEA